MIPRSRLLATVLFGGGAGVETLVHDTFTGANGTAITAHTPDINTPGNSWANMKIATTDVGVAANTIQTNKAKLGPDNHGVVIDCGQTDVTVTVDWTPAASVANRNSVVVRYSSNGNEWIFNVREENGDMQLTEVNANVSSVRAGPLAFAWAEGTTYALKVVCSGNTITCYVNEVQKLQYTSATFNNNATKYGICRNSGNDASRFDNLKVNFP